MSEAEAAAVIALLRAPGSSVRHLPDQLETQGSAIALLQDSGGVNLGPPRLFNDEDHVQQRLELAAADLARWAGEGIEVLTVLDREYPDNLRAVHDRPPMIFVAGKLTQQDDRSVAVIGARRASAAGLAAASMIAEHLVSNGYTVVSGLAAGIDAAAHTAALTAKGRTVAVIGTGLQRCYPPQNRALQQQIARDGAVISQFWPDAEPSQHSFPARNAVMSGISRATVIVEASVKSGARAQARMALNHGRPVFVRETLLEQAWARELAARPGTSVFSAPDEITSRLKRLESGALVA